MGRGTVSVGERIIMDRKKDPADHREFFFIQWTLENEGNMSI
jgi:hypothetical protein